MKQFFPFIYVFILFACQSQRNNNEVQYNIPNTYIAQPQGTTPVALPQGYVDASEKI